MGWLIRSLLQLFGRPTFVRKYVTFASRSTDLLPVSRSLKPWLAAFAHAVPVIAVYLWILAFRRSEIEATEFELAAVILASTWCSVGPALIWQYERRTLPSLCKAARRYIDDFQEFRRIRSLIFSSAFDHTATRIIMAVWLPLVFMGLLSSLEYLSRFGLRGIRDPLAWVVAFGVMYVAAYAAVGISFAFRSTRLIAAIAKVDTKPAVYDRDGALGMAFLGRFALSTNLMYLSGWLLMPALMVSMSSSSAAPVVLAHLALGFAYTGVWVVFFLWPIWLVHQRIQQIKCDLAEDYGKRAAACSTALLRRYDERKAQRFGVARAVYQDVRAISNWPLSVDAIMRFTISVVLFPLLVNILAVWWVT